MKVQNYIDHEVMSQAGAGIVRSVLKERPDALVCLATGSSPRRMYEILGGDEVVSQSPFRALALDEWYGLAADDPATGRSFLERQVFGPWQIPGERQFVWNAQARDPVMECQRMSKVLEREGPIDLCILGIGQNGHLGFNEPADVLHPHAHVAVLEASSQNHAMVADAGIKPTHGLTFGMADILAAGEVLMLLAGSGKEAVARQFLRPEVSTRLPASLLHLHSSVTVLNIL